VSRPLLPPEIPGLTYVSRLGAGGYADVHLYEQQMPARRVAVKVLRESGLSASAVARFTAEANAMARLEHPHIVPVYAAGVTPDGRPYLVMMYYPRASLAERARSEKLSVAEVLRIGIQIGSAVETAHRAGLLHRDIKPANVLTNQYGTPGLTDFGIAAQIADVDDEDTGVSVPWSPPEVLYATAPASARSDVYSLASTLWHLLVGRSPFEVPDGDNSNFALMKRIRDGVPPATGRPDVPASLERLLRSAMSREPSARPSGALDLVRSLQAIEQELRYQRTPIVVAEEDRPRVGPAGASPAADATRVKGAQVIAAQSRDLPPVGDPAPPVADRTVLRSATPPPGADGPAAPTRQRVVAAAAEPEDEAPLTRRTSLPVVGIVVLVVAAIIGVGYYLATTQPKHSEQVEPTALQTPLLGEELQPPGPLTFQSETVGGEVRFTWTYARPAAGDTFSWRLRGSTATATVSEPAVTVPAAKSGRTCIEVRVDRAGGLYADQEFEAGCQK
jgi:hypothetical protein